MQSPKKPNLFSYATSELSQDAFLCWFADCSNPKYDGVAPALRGSALALLNLVMARGGYAEIEKIKKLEVSRQYKNIDVLIRIECGDGRIISIIIEDKTHTSEHSGQIERYRNIIAGEADGPDEIIVPVLLKTGDMLPYDRADKERAVVSRSDMIAILRAGVQNGIENDIYLDFLEHLEIWEREYQAYATRPIDSWNGSQWCGFFEAIHGRVTGGNGWDYVSTPTGGFWELDWGWREVRDAFFGQAATLYLQLEEGELCFKAMLGDDEEREKRKWPYHNAIIDSARALNNTDVVKRPRFATGAHTTLAYWPGYRVTRGADKTLDLEATLENLKQAEEILVAAAEKIQ